MVTEGRGSCSVYNLKLNFDEYEFQIRISYVSTDSSAVWNQLCSICRYVCQLVDANVL